MAIWEHQSYLITGSKSGSIKVWNSQYNLLYEMKEHYQTVTGLCIAPIGSFTYLLSCSLDSNIRMWSLDDGICLNKINTMNEINGITWMKNSTFSTYSNSCVSVWSVSKFFIPFSNLGSSLNSMKRIEGIEDIPTRILGLGSNGSVIVMSPKTGEKLFVINPFVSGTTITDGVYDPIFGKIYLLENTGRMMVYSAIASPGIIIQQWNILKFQEKVICIAGLPAQKDVLERVFCNDLPVHYFQLLGGTDSGQIVARDVRDQGAHLFLVQAHSAPITNISVDLAGLKVVTASKDGSVKIWNIYYSSANNDILLKDVMSTTGKRVALKIRFTGIQISSLPTIPDFVSSSVTARQVRIASRDRKVMVYQSSKETPNTYYTVKGHTLDDEHSGQVTDFSCLDGILATSSLDGTVKIWDGESNSLIRYIPL